MNVAFYKNDDVASQVLLSAQGLINRIDTIRYTITELEFAYKAMSKSKNGSVVQIDMYLQEISALKDRLDAAVEFLNAIMDPLLTVH